MNHTKDEIITVKEGDLLLAKYIPSEFAWKGGLNFFSADEDFIQVGTWGYDSGKNLKAHIHNHVKREVNWTQETLFVKKGRIRADIYNTKSEKLKSIQVNEGDIIVLLRGAHGYEVLEDDTQVLEIKNGPYVGADLDRRRIQ